MTEYRIEYDGDWTGGIRDGRELRFATRAEAEKWWSAYYRGPKSHMKTVEENDTNANNHRDK
jgi:hypothetical protein